MHSGCQCFTSNFSEAGSALFCVTSLSATSIRSYDREEKFEVYRSIPSFQKYLLVDQNRVHVEQFSKLSKKQWSLCEYDEEDEAIVFSTFSFQISLADFYSKVKFETAESTPHLIDKSSL
ncbi:MAG: Uma2 family endonuclease [Scytolyngbya sp. HA4215-MV1]|jgi:Uma2 family endonuclease|nr:Uma2 family endonuclease [Scytolyngbya sp. HA4215-MV1]